MLSFCQTWRESGWKEIPPEEYAAAWYRHGGSVMTHPEIVRSLSALADIPVRYLGRPDAAIATWGRHLALSRKALKAYGKKGLFDLGNAEVIIPCGAAAAFSARFQMQYVSERNAGQITNLKRQKESIALARAPKDYSSKFLYNQRREHRLFEEQGGKSVAIQQFSASEISRLYADLFFRRWNFEVPGKSHQPEVFACLRDFMTGSVLFMQDDPVAIQILYQVESPQWISVEYINGGVAPDFHKLSPGSILTYLNTQAAWAKAAQVNKQLRYSFGRVDREYKMRWCDAHPVFKT